MTIALSRRDRRTLLGGAGAIVALVVLAKGLPAWRAWDTDTRAAAEEMIGEARRAERSVAALPTLRDTLVARNERYLALAELIVSGDGPASAAGELAAFVSGTATAANLAIGAMQVRADSATGDAFARASAQGDLTGDVAGLTSFLAAVERGPFLLAVRELSITQPEPAAPADRPEMLRVHFVIEGLALRRTSKTAERRQSEGT